jgi:hypothetical protein
VTIFVNAYALTFPSLAKFFKFVLLCTTIIIFETQSSPCIIVAKCATTCFFLIL